MTSTVCVVQCGEVGPHLPPGSSGFVLDVLFNDDNRHSPCEGYQKLFEGLPVSHLGSKAEIQIYIHTDVTIHDPGWHSRVMKLFERPEVAVVGLGGAPRLGHPDMYKKPYMLKGMARDRYVSNQSDWEVHGGRETGAKRVAVVDAFFMAVRTNFLRSAGGWPVAHLTHHCLDLWVCLEAARRGKEVWMTGVSCTHHGGGTSTRPAYRDAKWLRGGTLESDHQEPHRWLFDEYRDCLPLEV